MLWYAVHLVFVLFAPVYLTGQLNIKLLHIPSAFSDSNNASTFTNTTLMNLEEFSENQSVICEISSNKNCTDIPTAHDITNLTDKILNSDKLKNKTDLIETVSLEFDFEKFHNPISELNGNLTNSNSLITSENKNSTLIESSYVANSSLLLLVPLQNATQNDDTSESVNISTLKVVAIKATPVLKVSKAVRKMDSKLNANFSSANLNHLTCTKHMHALFELQSTVNKMFPMKNVIFISNSPSVELNFRRLLERIRDTFDALLQFRITTPSNDVIVVDNIDKILMQINNSSVADSRNFCPKQWIYFAATNSCYFMEQNSTVHDSDLAIYSTHDAFLSSINDSNEMDFIRELVGNDTHLIDLLKEQYQWYWNNNNAELNYTNWHQIQSNDFCGMDMNFVTINSNKTIDDQWNIIDCNITRAKFLCKKEFDSHIYFPAIIYH